MDMLQLFCLHGASVRHFLQSSFVLILHPTSYPGIWLNFPIPLQDLASSISLTWRSRDFIQQRRDSKYSVFAGHVILVPKTKLYHCRV